MYYIEHRQTHKTLGKMNFSGLRLREINFSYLGERFLGKSVQGEFGFHAIVQI